MSDKKYYTYLIGWSKLNKWYYGVRYSKKTKPKDLWVSYFTSSKIVKDYRKLYGEPDIIQIRKTFDCPIKAHKFESGVLVKLNVRENKKWINLVDNNGGINNPPSHKNKIWINNGVYNKRITPDSIKEYENFKIGRLLGAVKFFEHGNRVRDTKTGRFIGKVNNFGN